MEHKEKNFKVMKWIIFPLLVLGLGIGICYVSTKIFGVSGSIPYYIFIAICFAISIIYIWHTGNHSNKYAMVAAFCFECVGVLALAITLICGVVVLRKFTGMSETVSQQSKQALEQGEQNIRLVQEMQKLKSAKAQTKLATSLPSQTDSKEDKITLAMAYDEAEYYLFWPLVGETLSYLVGLMTVFGLVLFLGKDFGNHIEEPLQYPTNTRATIKTQTQSAPLRTRNPTKRFTSLSDPQRFFKLYWQQSGWRVHDETKVYRGHIAHQDFDSQNVNSFEQVEKMI